jgi:hypothetical protein
VTDVRRELADPGTYHKLPCGCEMWNQGDQFAYRPCSFTCEHYQYVLAASARQGHPIEMREE